MMWSQEEEAWWKGGSDGDKSREAAQVRSQSGLSTGKSTSTATQCDAFRDACKQPKGGGTGVK